MNKKYDLLGQTFDRWLVVAPAAKLVGQHRAWLCRCVCGLEKAVAGHRLRNGTSRSCGCLVSDSNREKKTKHGHAQKGAWSRTYSSWRSMRQRCGLPTAMGYEQYGGRGISVCERWRTSFESFLADMGERPAGTTLDRINVDGNYEPSNCRWASRSVQNYNKRNSILEEHEPDQIKWLAASGYSRREIARFYEIRESVVGKIVGAGLFKRKFNRRPKQQKQQDMLLAGPVQARSGRSAPRDLVGRQFGRLTVIGLHAVNPPRWVCRCSCGSTKTVYGGNLTQGYSTSCGCRRVETLAAKRTHGHTSQAISPTYKTWAGIKRRCLNPNEESFARYSKLGICDRWRDSFEAFLADMGEKPGAEYSIDRIDNTRGYWPGNCRWATRVEQAHNTSATKLTTESAAKIRQLSASGVRQRDIATQFGVSQRLVGLVVKGVVWK